MFKDYLRLSFWKGFRRRLPGRIAPRKEAPERVLAEFRKWGMRGHKYLGQWKGYEVWIFSPADRFDVQYFGGVFCVLDDGESARGSSPKEGKAILDYFYPKS